jgi:hypothetical protein
MLAITLVERDQQMTHPGKGVHTNREDSREFTDADFDQLTAVVEASVAEAILPEQPRASDAAGRDMHEHGVAGRDQGGARLGHRHSVPTATGAEQRRSAPVRVRPKPWMMCDGPHSARGLSSGPRPSPVESRRASLARV